MNLDILKDKISEFNRLEKSVLIKYGNYESLLEQSNKIENKLIADKEKIEILIEASEFMRKISTFLREGTKQKIETIVTEALNEIFADKDLDFQMRFEEKRNVNNLDFIIVEDGEEYSILNSRGGGIVNVVSTILRIIFIHLQATGSTTIFLDEPASNLSKQYQRAFGKFLAILSERLGHQMIIVTHNSDIASECHNSITIVQDKNGISQPRQS